MGDDLDFVWKRAQAPPPRPSAPTAPAPAGVRWVMVRDAAEQVGVSVSTIRNWARKGKVPSTLAAAREGPRRMVGLDEAVARARQLGRLPGESATPPPPSPVVAAGDGPVPEGHLLVPLDAWEKMLLQLGNLHAAGQDLASARERAAKAETEAAFLRERVAELREERDRLRGRSPGAPSPPAAPAVEGPTGPGPPRHRRLATWLRRGR